MFGTPGRDLFSHAVLAPLNAVESVHRLGAHGVRLHDDDLVPQGTNRIQRNTIVTRFRAALEEASLKVTKDDANPFSRLIVKKGVLTANDPAINRFAVRKRFGAIEI